MVMKSYTKIVIRCFKSNLSRFLIILAVTLLGLAFISGLGNISPVIRKSYSEGLKKDNVYDVIVKNKTENGFSNDDIADLTSIYNNVISYDKVFSVDSMIQINDETSERARFFCLDDNFKCGSLVLTSGNWPENENEIVVEEESMVITKKEIGQKITYMNQEFTIVGTVHNPLYFFKQGEAYMDENTTVNDVKDLDTLQLIIYSFRDYISSYLSPYLPYTDCYIKIKSDADYFTDEYDNDIKAITDQIKKISNDYEILTLNDNLSYAMLDNYCDKVNIIVLVFPIFFLAVTALVVFSSMSRMIEEERSIIACFKTLGYSNFKIYLKYLLFSFLSVFLGSIIGSLLGIYILPIVIYPAFETVFYLPKMVIVLDFTMGIIVSIIMIIVMVFLTYYLLRKNLKCTCASLLLPKSPKAGKKILLEHIKFIWNPLSFRFKSSIRNIIRYKGHLIMTVVSVAGSYALEFAGFALYDISNNMEKYGYQGLKDTLIPISVVIIIFGLLLCMLVVYNLTNMNIKERNKEMATLKVLGYYNNEAIMYIYREILMMAFIGVIFGIPIGIGLIIFVTNLLGFGSITDVMWYGYILSILCIFLFIFFVDLLLSRKIKKIDMTTSLKSVD